MAETPEQLQDRFEQRGKKQNPQKKYAAALHEIKALQKDIRKKDTIIATTDMLIKALIKSVGGVLTVSKQDLAIIAEQNIEIVTKENHTEDTLSFELKEIDKGENQ